MRHSHHIHALSGGMTSLVVRPHHGKVLKHDKDVPNCASRDIFDQVRSDFRSSCSFTDTGLGSREELHLNFMTMMHIRETRTSLPNKFSMLINVVEMATNKRMC